MDSEAGTATATGGLMAQPKEASSLEVRHHCADCGSQVVGRFCSHCGQAAHVHRTLTHLGEEILHGVMHFDGRLWRTLPLLVANPGRLTREWIEGKRTRYVSPLAMFLFTLFVMFMALSFAPQPDILSAGKAQMTPAEAAAVEAAEARAQAVAPWQKEASVDLGDAPSGFAYQLEKKLKNPEFAAYKVQQTLYKFSFLLVPLSIPFMALLFLWRRGITLYDHGVTILYSLTFMAMLLMTTVVLTGLIAPLAGWVVGLACLAVPLHMFAQMKGAYSLGVFGALWRVMVLLVFCSLILGLFMLAIVYLGLGH